MNSESRVQRQAKNRRRTRLFVFILVPLAVCLWVYLSTHMAEPLDDQGCPRETGPAREVLLLVDTSDPLTDKHKEELGRILREMTSPASTGRHDELAVREGERVTLYGLEGAEIPRKPLAQICHPGGNPEEQERFSELTRGSVITQWHWENFKKVIEGMFPRDTSEAQPSSPILEALAVITPRHSHSRRAAEDARPTHLIIISDLLQNTPILSHYTSYPPPQEIPRELRTDLSRVKVSLFRLERHKYEIYQTPEHYYWWTDLIEELGGTVVWQQAL